MSEDTRPVISSHALDRWRERVTDDTSDATIKHIMRRIVVDGYDRPRGPRWARVFTGPRAGSRFIGRAGSRYHTHPDHPGLCLVSTPAREDEGVRIVQTVIIREEADLRRAYNLSGRAGDRLPRSA